MSAQREDRADALIELRALFAKAQQLCRAEVLGHPFAGALIDPRLIAEGGHKFAAAVVNVGKTVEGFALLV